MGFPHTFLCIHKYVQMQSSHPKSNPISVLLRIGFFHVIYSGPKKKGPNAKLTASFFLKSLCQSNPDVNFQLWLQGFNSNPNHNSSLILTGNGIFWCILLSFTNKCKHKTVTLTFLRDPLMNLTLASIFSLDSKET